VLAHWAGGAIAGFAPSGDIPINDQPPHDWRPYVFTFLVSAVAGIVTGVWPALKATRFDVVESLKDGGSTAGASRHTLRNLLVVGQVTMSLVVLVSGGLFLHSLRQLHRLDIGFRPEGLLMASVDLGLQQYSDTRGRRFLEDLVTRVEALPGVKSASVATHVPFDYGIVFTEVRIEGEIPGSKEGFLSIASSIVGPNFFETAEVSLARGRGFDRRDEEGLLRVGIVNDSMARTLWAGGCNRTAIPAWLKRCLDRSRRVAQDEVHAFRAAAPALSTDRRTTARRSRSSYDRHPIGGARKPLQRLLNEMDRSACLRRRTMTDHMRDSVFAMPLRAARRWPVCGARSAFSSR
jgi:hypothetical protein